MMMATESKPSFEETYGAAVVTSDMTVTVHQRTAADVVIAAGMSHNQLGRALMHLRAEWDRCDKPRKAPASEIAKRAAILKDKKGRPDLRRAAVEAISTHAGAMRARAMKLTGRNLVIGLLTQWAEERGVDVDLISPAVFHWLAPKCPACDGLGHPRMVDAPALESRTCHHCGGAGTWPRPLGAQEIHDHMKKCVGQAMGTAKVKLYG